MECPQTTAVARHRPPQRHPAAPEQVQEQDKLRKNICCEMGQVSRFAGYQLEYPSPFWNQLLTNSCLCVNSALSASLRYPFMLVRNFIFWLSTKRSVTNSIARRGMKHGFARRFVAGETLAEALAASQDLCQQGRNVSLNHLGENVTTEAAAREVCASYIQMIEEMHAKNLAGNISIKLTQLGLDLGRDLCASLASSIARRARDLGRTIEMDMEGSAYTDATLDIFGAVQR